MIGLYVVAWGADDFYAVRKAAEQVDVVAQKNLDACYFAGDRVKEDK